MNVNKILLKLLSDRLGRSADKLELAPRINILGGKLPDLTASEKKAITDIWQPISAGNLNLDYWKFYKSIIGGEISPILVPDNIYWSRIIRALNPVSLTRTYINKSLYPIIFNGLRQPEILVNVINGVPYDGKMNRITHAIVVDILSRYENEIIIKPTVATSGGKGISKIHPAETLESIKHTLAAYGHNYICQGLVRQSKTTALFNASSLNTFRVNTLNINGETTCECLMMRHGLNGNIVDNFAVGGVVCGMTAEGKFNGNNFNTRLERLSQLQNGTPYTNLSVPSIANVIDSAINAHQKYMPHIGHAAWDFAIDENEHPVMIEVNLMLPGIMMEQLSAGGPVFGNRTEEVIHYAMTRNASLRWSEFVGGWQ